MQSLGGLGAETLAGGSARWAGEVAEQNGAPPWVVQVAEIFGGGLILPALTGAHRAAGGVLTKTPGAAFVGRTVRDLQGALLPMTEGGAREQAATRLRGLVGGEERAAQLAQGIDVNDPLNTPPAMQTEDPNLLGLQNAAAAENPLLRERLTDRIGAGRETAAHEIDAMSGDVADAREFFDKRLRDFKAEMNENIDTELQMGDESIEGVGPRQSESGASTNAVERVNNALEARLVEERGNWDAVPFGTEVSTQNTRDVVADLIAKTPKAQQKLIPAEARRLMARGDDGIATNSQIQDDDTVAELYGLYSDMRQVARDAKSGPSPNENVARMANDVADAILIDLGTVDPATAAGKAINEARAFSRALHETFDEGTVGRILQKTRGGGDAMASEVALSRTVGRGRTDGSVAAREIQAAAPGANEEIGEFLRIRFADAVMDVNGEFTPKKALAWMKNNRELLGQNPELSKELRRALSSRNAAHLYSVRNQARAKLIADQSGPARFNLGQPQKAVLSILSADNPAKTATTIINAARKSNTGDAVAGVKAAFTDHLLSGDNVNGGQIAAMLKDKNMAAAMAKVFNPAELQRLTKIATSLARLEGKDAARLDGVIHSSTNKLLEFIVGNAAAVQGAKLGGGNMGGSIRTAGMAVNRANEILNSLTNVRARALLMDAIEDPQLFKELLNINVTVPMPPATRARLAPYLTGAAGVAGTEEEPSAANEGTQQ